MRGTPLFPNDEPVEQNTVPDTIAASSAISTPAAPAAAIPEPEPAPMAPPALNTDTPTPPAPQGEATESVAPVDAAYQRARATAKAALALELVELAEARLEAEGLAALSMRRLASAAGCSTMVLYSTFGDKATLLNQLARREAERWVDEATMIADPDPVVWLDVVASALWAAATRRPQQRALLFDETIGSEALPALRVAMLEAIDRALSGAREDGIAETIWSAWVGAIGDGDQEKFAQVQRGLARLWGLYVRSRI
jgi:AcrR family transcriptional regulator